MHTLKLSYAIKGLMPRSVQIRLRQVAAQRNRKHVSDIWPIMEHAGSAPPNWRGWPLQKQFALVLTHDVEMERGVSRCRMIMDLEERLGFRSVFNFVPERYDVPPALRREITQRGFEVGVHGLYHDLSLFQSADEFQRQAPKINRYIRDWGATGFRAPYMIRNLAWIRDHLDIAYDSSTFDTDPFEPMPEDIRTIFPFIVDDKGNSGRSYVELPCTLPQDLNLFVLLGETGIDIWKQKLAWIANRGGMALFDTHPDYMCNLSSPGCDEYPLAHYEAFLKEVKAVYADRCWHALPRDVASFCRDNPDQVRHGIPKRLCMMAYSFYDCDGRIMRYAETLVREGHAVDAISLGRKGQPWREMLHGVRVNRIQTRTRDERNLLTYLARMARFFFKSSRVLAREHSKTPYDVVHVHSVPDFEVFAAWNAKWHGARLILDIHDLLPEFYASKFKAPSGSFISKVLRLVERLSAWYADHVIIANHLWREILIHRSVPPEKCSVVLNCVDPAIFYRHQRTRQDDRFIIVYPGGLQSHQGVDVAVSAFAMIRHEAPHAEFHIYGEGSESANLMHMINELQLKNRVFLKAPVPIREVPDIMANADLGIVAKRANSFGNEAYSTKILEFMSQGIPVVVSRTKVDMFYFDDSVVRFFESGNAAALAEALLEMIHREDLRLNLVAGGSRCVAHNSWQTYREDYLNLIDKLCPPHAL
jgi:glycosyltransferase involved in cell wall biosynthesis/peptidoglycan/xylan/chitin deacetylase (PgdA/CDA1 family)